MSIDLSTLAPSCPMSTDPSATPDCARRLVLAECQKQMRAEGQFGEIDTGRYRCRYIAWGRGTTLVLIPGMASEAESFVMLLARLRSRFRCIAYDLPDGVHDGARLMRYRHADLVGDLFALLDHLKIRECALHGFSFGSTIALAAVHRSPSRFTHLVLQSGFAQRRLARTEILAASFARFLPGRLGHLPMVRTIVEKNHREPFLARESAVWDYFVERHCAVPLRAFAHRILMLHAIDLRAMLPTILVPALLVCGDRDPLVGRTCEAELQAGLKLCARAEIEQCGHHAHLTHPEVLAEVLQQFQAQG
ncbi:MAG: alpha/beta hydrolase [Gemmataceae bacterium]|nr:alpha/beta hydrolase [Gemmataceae bacterium]